VSLVGFLTSTEAREVLDALDAEPVDDLVRLVSGLRTRFPPEQVSALVEMHRSREAARRKFGPHADTMLYTASAVEQATPALVAVHRSRRFAGARLVADLGCGVGGDAIHLPGTVVGVDLDHVRLTMARHNVGADRFIGIRADLATLPAIQTDAAFADPSRRDASGRRVFDVERYSPPLSLLLDRWLPVVPSLCVKVHPGVDHDAIPGSAEAEFVSLDGDMRECALWFGELRTEATTRATLLPTGESLVGRPSAVGLEVAAVSSRIHEPDPAVLRAGLVGDLAARLGLAGIDPTIAYLTGDADISSPFVRSYQVETVMPFNAKKIRAHLRAGNVGEVTVKKRGSAVDPEAFRRNLGLRGDERRVVILTRAAGQPVAVICLQPS
jgi:hypothetical protein